MKLFLVLAIVALVGCAVEGRAIRDAKSDLITKATDLVKKADEAIKTLEAGTSPNKAHEITIVKTEEARIQKLAKDLEAATDDAKVKVLEHELTVAENRLTHELARVNHTPTGPVVPVPANPVTRDLKSDLIAKGNALLVEADAAVVKLEAAHSVHEAALIKTEEAHIKKLIADLTDAVDAQKVHALELELTHAETRLRAEVARANHTPVIGPVIHLPVEPIVIKTPVARDLKSDLITKGTALVKQAEEAITKLSADTRHAHEVTVIKAEEARIQKLITDLTAATETAAITHLERELGALEARLQHELTRINHTGPAPVVPVPVPTNPVTRALKDTLITRGDALVKQAEAAITKLEAEHKTHEASIVKAEETQIKKLVADLSAATEETAIVQLERELAHLESRLANELNRINHPIVRLPHVPEGPVVRIPEVPVVHVPVTRDLKSDLITKGTALVKQAEEAVTKLSADTRHAHEVTVIKAEEARIQKLITDLTAATETVQITHLERELQALEARLAHELNRINHTGPAPVVPVPANPVATRDLKSDLITKGNALVKQAEEAITKLTADKKTHEVTVIKAEEARIQKAITDLTAATEAAQITHFEHELQALEARLTHELNRINHTGPVVAPPANPVTRDLKSDLIAKGNDLVKKADDAIKVLEAAKNKAHEVTVIKAEEAHIQKLITDLTAATETAQIAHLEQQLRALEARFEHEINRINHTGPILPANPITTRDAKSDLIAKAQALVTKADEAIKTLEAAHKTHEVTVVKTEEAHIQKLITDLTAATEAAAITRLEHELIQADFRLQHELARVNHTPTGPVVPVVPANPANPITTRDLKSDLITKGNDLVKKAEEAVTKLTADKKTHEATVIKTEEAHLQKLITDLTAATETMAITRLEHELQQAERRLESSLLRVNHTPVPVVPVPTNP